MYAINNSMTVMCSEILPGSVQSIDRYDVGVQGHESDEDQG